MNQPVRVFLDLDGPLLDGKERHYYCYKRILESFHATPLERDAYWELKRARIDRRDLLQMTGIADKYEEFLSEWLAIIESPEALALDRVHDGALGCLRNWQENGVVRVLVTMRRDVTGLHAQLESTGLAGLLNQVVCCDHAQGWLGKADAVRHLDLEDGYERTALWVGDTEVDWAAAKALGLGVILVASGLREESFLRTLDGAIVKQSIGVLTNCIPGYLKGGRLGG